MLEHEVLPPHDLEAELALIGSLLVDGAVFPQVAEAVGEADFYRESHATAFRAMAELYRAGGVIDELTVADRIRAAVPDEQTRSNLRAMLAVAISQTPTSVNAPHYAGIVRRCADLRRVLDLSRDLMDAAMRPGADPGEIARRVVDGGVALGRADRKQALRPLREFVDASFNRLHEMYEHGVEAVGIRTGLTVLDRKLGGLQRGKFYVVGARTSAGKSTLCVQIAVNIAEAGGRVVYFSLEESSLDLLSRMVSVAMDADWRRLTTADRALRASDFARAVGRVSDLPILTTDAARLSVGDMHGQAAVVGLRHPDLRLIVVDYLNLTDEPRLGREGRVEVVGRITRGLKRLARELDVPVIAAAQLNRESEHRQSRVPVLSDLREAGDVEQDADAVILLYRPQYYVERNMAKSADVRPEGFKGTDEDLALLLRADVAKNRQGPIGPVNLLYDPRTGRIQNWMGRGENEG